MRIGWWRERREENKEGKEGEGREKKRTCSNDDPILPLSSLSSVVHRLEGSIKLVLSTEE